MGLFSKPKQPPLPEREPVPAPEDQVARAARDAERQKQQARGRYGSSGSRLARQTAPRSLASGGGDLYAKGALG